MSAHDQMRAMLDQLMGTARNGETNRYSVKFYDSKVCKSFLLGCCPHEILASTTVTTRRFFLICYYKSYQNAMIQNGIKIIGESEGACDCAEACKYLPTFPYQSLRAAPPLAPAFVRTERVICSVSWVQKIRMALSSVT